MAKKVTSADVQAAIARTEYFNTTDGMLGKLVSEGLAAGLCEEHAVSEGVSAVMRAPAAYTRMTFCVLTLHNGFSVVGTSACADPETFDAETGRSIARADAIDKVWELLGFRLRDELHAACTNE